jgi:hypothetical protein
MIPCPKRIVLAVGLALSAALHGGAAQAQDRWTAVSGEARIELPAAGGEHRVEAAFMVCAERRWALEIRLAEELPAGPAAGTVSVDGRDHAVEGTLASSVLTLPVPQEVLAPLKAGLRLRVELAGEAATALGSPIFALRGSRVAIDAAAPLCSAPDMTAYEEVVLASDGEGAELARELRADDIAAFRTSTASDARVEHGSALVGEDREIIFVRLCGSSWYYGASGCSLTGHMMQAGGWRTVFESEGAALHQDRGARDGGLFRLVTLPATAMAPISWRWSGSSYRPIGD